MCIISSYKNNYAKILAVIVLAMNLSLLLSLGLWYYGNITFWYIAIAFGIKYCIDYLLLYITNSYLRKKKLFPPLASSLLYPLFSSLVAIYSIFGSYRWKGRSFYS
jgi:hypothetical protein